MPSEIGSTNSKTTWKYSSEERNCKASEYSLPCATDRNGKYGLILKQPFRLVIEPANNPLPMKNDGTEVDCSKITQIYVLEVVDYHD